MIPVHRRGEEDEQQHDRFFKIRQWLNTIFLIGAMIGVAIYFFYNSGIGTMIILCSIVLKMGECCLRLLR